MATKNTWGTVERKNNPRGLAEITFGKNKVRVEFSDGTIKKDFPKDELPEFPEFIHKLKEGTRLDAFVVLSTDKQSIERIGPDKGRAFFHVIDFVRPEKDSDPAPKEYEGNDKYKKEGQSNTYKAFSALLEITDGKWKGCVISTFLHYKFDDDGRGYTAFTGDPSKSKNSKTLRNFCEAAGATAKPLPWPEDGNILPDLLKVMLRADKTFEAQIENGYISNILLDMDDEDDIDELFPADEPVKKTKAKSKK